MLKTIEAIFEPPENECIVSMCIFRDVVILATDRRVYRITDANDDAVIKAELVEFTDPT